MRSYFPFVLIALLVTGCGGKKPETFTNAGGTGLPSLGSSSLNLSLAGGQTRSATMKGSGNDAGYVQSVDPTPNAAGTLNLDAQIGTRERNPSATYYQKIDLVLAHSASLAIGQSFTLGGTSNYMEYGEINAKDLGDSVGIGASAVAGTVTVTSISDGSIGFRFDNVVAPIGEAGATLTISGTVVGTLVASDGNARTTAIGHY